jgi:hypothetical protein
MSHQDKRAKTEHKDVVFNDLAFNGDLFVYFSFLDFCSLSVAIRVSRGWRLVVVEVFRLSTRLRCPSLPPANHLVWASPFLDLQEVVVARTKFRQEHYISTEQLMVIRQRCPQLTSLTLHGHTMRTDSLRYLFLNLKLTSLTLLDMKFITISNSQTPTQTTPCALLDRLCIKRCDLKAGSLVPLTRQQTQLTQLDLSFTEVKDGEIETLLVAIPSLHTLRLVHCRNITGETITLANNSKLSVLDVCMNPHIVVPPSLRGSLSLMISPASNS